MTILNYNRRAYPSPVGPMVVLAVLVERREGLCVYCGIMPDGSTARTFPGETEWVRQHGNKVPFNEAQSHFPGIPADRYAFP